MKHCRFRRAGSSLSVVACSILLLGATVHTGQRTSGTSWLDRPLAGWNKAAAPVPKATPGGESRDQILKRCRLELRRSTLGETALADAGWIPMAHLTQALAKGDVEIVDGVVGVDNACEPAEFNSFVFVGGKLAGTLSPAAMTFRRDGAAGAIRIIGADEITVDFIRYRETDTECCPSSHAKAWFRINRTITPPIVEPVDVQTTR